MCAIFGTYSFNGSTVLDSDLKNMSKILNHRGPDANGFYSDGFSAIGNCRLSIIDLTESSNQPLFSEDKNIVIVQNGEIYNYIELKDQLLNLGHTFYTDGDTEVILKAYQEWGPLFVKRLNGMFSVAIFDKNQEKIFLYRDRLGVKPLYISGDIDSGRLWFASEIKAILRVGVQAKPDLDAIAQFLALNYIPCPKTAFVGISQVEPGHMIELSKEDIKVSKYWDLSEIKPDVNIDYNYAKDEIINILDDATKIRMRSDAPYGAFLSGGIDSSSVVGFMKNHKSEKIKTFSMGFSDPRFDETKYAIMASKRFNTLHTSKIMEYDATSMWPKFIWYTDQPHGDISFIPTYMVSQLAVKETKMVLTGDGGDELFAGYNKYVDFFKNAEKDKCGSDWEKEFASHSGLLTKENADLLLEGELKEIFLNTDPFNALSNKIDDVPHQDSINKILYAETSVLLPGNNLVKPDRMAMANSLEVRSPYLDYRLAEFSFTIPGKYKLKKGITKSILKETLLPLLGPDLTYRKKQMFTVPIGEWFKTNLKNYCENILFDGRLNDRGIINEKNLKKAFQDHCDGIKNYTREIRAIISLELWFRIYIDNGIQDLNSIEKIS